MTWSMWQKTFPYSSANIGFGLNFDNPPPITKNKAMEATI